MILKKEYIIKIPSNVAVLYCKRKELLVCVKQNKRESLRIPVDINLFVSKKLIIIQPTSFSGNKPYMKSISKAVHKRLIAQIRQVFVRINYLLYKRVNLVGVGYRSFPVEGLNNQLHLKLGYSHSIYLRVFQGTDVKVVKPTRVVVYGDKSPELVAKIRDFRPPEPYKGKGVLYEGEKILLKKGKQI